MKKNRYCAALGCGLPIGREAVMCRQHWRLVPRPIQQILWSFYPNGSGRAYRSALRAAVLAVGRLKN
jgi:hypothetical protein